MATARPGPGPSSAELDEISVRRASDGDPAAFAALVETYQGAVFGLLWRMLGRCGHRALVEDLAQETFLAAYRALPRFSVAGSAKLSTWLLTIATRAALKALRRSRRVEPRADDLADLLPAPDSTEHTTRQHELARVVRQALDHLHPDHRAVLVLREYHDFDYTEIAAALTLDLGTVKSRLSRARGALRRALEEIDPR